jgi:hypothetical protein
LQGCWAQIRPELQALYPALAAADRPATIEAWLNKSAAPAIVRELAGKELTHRALDELPAGKTVEHLRSVLVEPAHQPVVPGLQPTPDPDRVPGSLHQHRLDVGPGIPGPAVLALAGADVVARAERDPAGQLLAGGEDRAAAGPTVTISRPAPSTGR